MLAWTQVRGNHLRCEDRDACLIRLLRSTDKLVELARVPRGGDLPEAA